MNLNFQRSAYDSPPTQMELAEREYEELMSDPDIIIRDEKGTEVKVGSIVNTSGELEFVDMTKEERIEYVKKHWSNDTVTNVERYCADVYVPSPNGLVTEITDFDGDVDDDTLKSITINPYVIVKWEDQGIDDPYPTTVISIDPGEIELEVSDLIVIQEQEENNA